MTRPRLLLFLLALLLGDVPAAGAQSRLVALSGAPPDVLILVAATSSGQDQIDITYAGMIPHAQAQRDLAALRAATGWTLRRVRITDAPSSLARNRTKMTGVQCVAARVVRPQTHGLTVQPFVQAFRLYPSILLTYFVGQGFQFQGLHDYADNDVRITLDQHGGAYTYQILIRNPRLERLNLPYLQPAASDVRAVRNESGVRPDSKRWLFALAAALALAAGCAVYALLSRAA
ncbi:MAG: hypothetical protein JO250_09370 [Armatimonadetes bacterium]|nr:hypothetical protein [Armatimonadota bacterium]